MPRRRPWRHFASAAKGAAPHLQWGQTATFQGDENIMGLSAQALKAGLDAIAAQTPASAPRWNAWAIPNRASARGYATMLRTIVGQQVSVAAAASMWRKLTAALGEDVPPPLLEADFDALRACGLSRQKQAYARSLCELVVAGELDFPPCPPTTRRPSPISPASRASGAGRPKSICCLPKGGPTSGPPAIWRCRCCKLLACPNGPAKRPRAKWPKSGARTRRGGDLHLALL
jgi:hypothetical protein